MYQPRRDYRFEYVHDVVHFIEEYQCYNCIFRHKGESEDLMCDLIAMPIILEEPVADLDDRGEHGVVCTLHEAEQPPVEPPDHNQLGLF